MFFCVCLRRYYKETDGLKLDVGVYMKALEVRACTIPSGGHNVHMITHKKMITDNNYNNLIMIIFCVHVG